MHHLVAAFRQQYGTVQDDLGSGGSGHIFSAVRRKDRKEVAVKLVPKICVPQGHWAQDIVYGIIPREVQIMKNIKHPSVIRFVDYFSTSEIILIVMELFGSSWKSSTVRPTDPNPLPLLFRPLRRRAMDLFELLEARKLTEEEVRIIFCQIVECIDYLLEHHHIIHGDIKDENILIDWSGPTPIAKLIDFGGAIEAIPNRLCDESDFHGTLEFASPEVILGKRYNAEKAEAWSLGVLLYGMVSAGTGPFASPQDSAFGGYRAPPCSEGCRHLIGRLLDKDPRSRAGIKDILNHPWFMRSDEQK